VAGVGGRVGTQAVLVDVYWAVVEVDVDWVVWVLVDDIVNDTHLNGSIS
jgi:hypothetical protein